MKEVELFKGGAGRLRRATEEDKEQFTQALSRLYAPHCYAPEQMQSIKDEYRGWYLGAEGHSANRQQGFFIAEYFDQLGQEEISREFRSCLSRLSSLRGAAGSGLDLGRFCEIRAAHAAFAVHEVRHVKIALPNSPEDKAKADIRLGLPGDWDKELPLQVKAVSGKRSRSMAGVPTLRNVLKSKLSDTSRSIAQFVRERLMLINRERQPAGRELSEERR